MRQRRSKNPSEYPGLGHPDGRDDRPPSTTLQHVDALRRAGSLARAEALLSALLRSHPNDPTTNYLAALVNADYGRLERAVALMEKAIARDRHNPGYYFDLGLMLNAQFRYKDAAAAFKRALKAQPRMHEAHNALGIALISLQRAREAVKCFDAAIAINPSYAEAYNNLGLAYIELGLNRQAIAHFEQAVRLEPGYALAVKNLGTAYVKQGFVKKARACFERGRQLRPGDLSILENAASSYFKLKLYEDAKAPLEAILSTDARHEKANRLYGKVLMATGRFEEAITYFDRALPVAAEKAELFSLVGESLVALGRNHDAVIHYRKAAALASKHLAELVAVERRAGLCGRADAIQGLESWLTNKELPISAQVEMHFLLGQLYDEAGTFDRAFENYKAGNDKSEKRLDRRRVGEFIAALSSEFSQKRLADLPRASNESKTPVFIVGLPRAGKTLLGNLLGEHPQVAVPDEIQSIGAYFDISIQRDVRDCQEAVRSVTTGFLDDVAGEYLGICAATSGSAVARVVNTLPTNFFHLGLIQLLFRNAKIINMERDPLDLALECYFTNLPDQHVYSFSHDLADTGFFLRRYQRLMQHWRSVLDIGILDVRYEDLVSAPVETRNDVLRFLEIEGGAELSASSDRVSASRAGRNESDDAITDRYVGRWQAYEKHLGPLVAELEK